MCSITNTLGCTAGIGILEKVYADRHVVAFADLVDSNDRGQDELPVPFRRAVAVTGTDCDSAGIAQAPGRLNSAPLLDWYELSESCDSSLMMRGLRGKWHLPCLASSRPGVCCECPFVAHVPRNDWDSLHALVRTSKMRWLLTHCSIFVPVASRAWLQVSGPVDKGQLDKAYPYGYSFGGLRKVIKRKRVKELAGETVVERPDAALVASVQRPLKKIRLSSSFAGQKVRVLPAAAVLVQSGAIKVDGSSEKVEIKTEETPPHPTTPTSTSTSTLVPRLTRVRLHRRNESPVVITLIASGCDGGDGAGDADDEKRRQLASGADGRRKRRGKKRARPAQIADKRRAIDGSILIPHDEILYSGSGWTHFPITHPLCRNTAKEAVAGILGTAVGTDCRDDHADVAALHRLVESMRKNHQRCRYASILRKMLAAAPEYEPGASSVPPDRVHQFVKCVIKKVVPVELMGDERNFNTFLANVRHFVKAGRGSSFTLAELVQSMRTAKCRWLRHLASLPLQVSLLARLVMWLFVDFVKPLVRQHFYATEASHGRNRVYFYTKDAWQRMYNRMMRCACSVSLKHPMPLLDKSPLGGLDALMMQSRLRFVPKKNDGHRPIMSTRFRKATQKEVASARLLLHTISGQYPEGMDAKSTHSLHRKWRDFLRRRAANGTTGEAAFFVHADVEDAFGSINHDKLVDILRLHAALVPGQLSVRTMCHVTPDGRRSRNFKLIPHFHCANVDDWVQRLAPGAVLFDLGHRADTLDAVKILEFAVQSVREVQVMHGAKQHYRLKRGIPQGSPLSSALCHIYYGHMVREHLAEFLNHPDDLLVRVVDDFLYLTPSEDRARRFHERVHQGFPDYNGHVNIAKSVTNLDLSGQAAGPARTPSPWTSFCGLQFNWRTLETRGDYTKYRGTDIIDCITPSAGQPGKLLFKRLQGVATLKLETMYLDSAVNRKPTVVRSVFHACLMAAFRFHAIVRHIVMRSVPSSRRNKPIDARFLAHQVIKKCCARIVAHISSIRRRRKDVAIALAGPEAAWLCYEAFRRKLAKHRPIYANVMPVVTAFLATSQSKLSQQQLANLHKWIGRRVPLSFRRMKHKALRVVNKACT